MPPRATVTIALNPELRNRIDAAARNAGLSRSAFIVGAVEAYLDEAETTLKAFANPKVRDAFVRAMTAPGVVQGIASAMGRELTSGESREILAALGASDKRRKGKR